MSHSITNNSINSNNTLNKSQNVIDGHMSNLKIIETELYRKHLYNNIVDKVSYKLKTYLDSKEIQHFLLRYIFNKIIERLPKNDPIFIYKYSDICYLQVEKDFELKILKLM